MLNFMLHVFYQEEKYENKQNKNERKKKNPPRKALELCPVSNSQLLKTCSVYPFPT